MLFNSYIFILLFLPVCIVGYFLLNKTGNYRIGLLFLLGMSLWFYGFFNLYYVFIIVGSILFNYGMYLAMNRSKKAIKVFLIIGIAGNLVLLVYFKYTDFFISNINHIFAMNFNLKNIILPLGISFFTFQQISFIVDTYTVRKQDNKIAYSLLEYATYISFFPQLVAGPIVTHDVLVPQLQDVSRKHINWESLSKGVALFVLGLAKKVLLADVFGSIVDYVYGDLSDLNATTAIFVMFAYTIQIYFDFGGYSDMAIGLGWMLNIELPVNFDSPYQALSVTEFWNKWHMTLTSFFTKYVYIPLGGSRRGTLRTYLNIMIVFLISGFWHGAGWNFVMWGGIHGIAQVIERLFKRIWERMHPVFSWVLSFGFVNVAWIFFRASGIGQAKQVLKAVVKMNLGELSEELVELFIQPEWRMILGSTFLRRYPMMLMETYFAVAFVIIMGLPNAKKIVGKMSFNILTSAGIAFLLVWCVMSLSGVTTFLYFNF